MHSQGYYEKAADRVEEGVEVAKHKAEVRRPEGGMACTAAIAIMLSGIDSIYMCAY